MGWFTKKKKKANSFDDDDLAEGGENDRDERDRERDGTDREGDDGPNGGGGGGGSGRGVAGGSDDNPYAEDPAHKQLVKVLNANGLIRHRRAFIRGSVYTVKQAKELDDERLKSIGVFLEADRKKLLRIFKDTVPEESVVDAERERAKEKEDEDRGRDMEAEKEDEKKSKKKKKGDKEDKKGKNKSDKKSKKDKDKGDRKDKKDKGKKKSKKGEDEDEDEDNKSSGSRHKKKNKGGDKENDKKERKSKSKSKKDDEEEEMEIKSKGKDKRKDKEKSGKSEEGRERSRSRDKGDKDRKKKDKGKKGDANDIADMDDDLYGDGKKDKSNKKDKGRGKSKGKPEADFSELEDLSNEANGVTKEKGKKGKNKKDKGGAESEQEDGFTSPGSGSVSDSFMDKLDSVDVIRQRKKEKSKSKGKQAPSTALETAELPNEGKTDAEKDEVVIVAAKPKRPKPSLVKKEDKNVVTANAEEASKQDGHETDIEMDGYESETLEAVENKGKPGTENTDGSAGNIKRRLSHGRKALSVLSEKLGFKKGSRNNRAESTTGATTAEEDDEELWWKSLEAEKPEQSHEPMKKRVKKRLSVRPEFAAKVEYVTDEESNVLQDFRSQKVQGYNGPIARRRGAHPLGSMANVVPNMIPTSPMYIPNMTTQPNTIKDPQLLSNIAQQHNMSPYSVNNAVVHSPVSIPPIPAAEKEEIERAQAKAIQGGVSTGQTTGQAAADGTPTSQLPAVNATGTQSLGVTPPAPAYGYNYNYPAVYNPYMGQYTNPYLTPYSNSLLNNSLYYTDVTDVDSDHDDGRDGSKHKRRSQRHRDRKYKRRSKKRPNSTRHKDNGYQSEITLTDPDISADDEVKIKKGGKKGKIVNNVEYVDLSKELGKGALSLNLNSDSDSLYLSDRDVMAGSYKRHRKPEKFGSDNNFTEYNYGSEEEGPIKHGRPKSYAAEHKINYYHSPIDGGKGKEKNGYESDTDLYMMRKKLAEVGASRFYPLLVKQGITSLNKCDMSKLEKLPIKSGRAKNALIKTLTRLRSGSKNLRTRIYNMFSNSSTENELLASEAEAKATSAGDGLGLKGVLKKSVKSQAAMKMKKESGRGQSRAAKSRHYFEVNQDTLDMNESDDDDNKVEAIDMPKSDAEPEKKSVKFDLDEDEDISLPDFSDNEQDSDSDMSLHSDYS